jgi:hypothetical protein
MFAPRPRITPSRRLVWLLWFALLLPVAQAAASWHAMAHVGASGGYESDTPQAPHLAACDLCLTAAALTGAAPVAEAPSFAHPGVRHGLPQVDADDIWRAPAPRAYRSRAPPPVQR